MRSVHTRLDIVAKGSALSIGARKDPGSFGRITTGTKRKGNIVDAAMRNERYFVL
jgi:hypothetical protein